MSGTTLLFILTFLHILVCQVGSLPQINFRSTLNYITAIRSTFNSNLFFGRSVPIRDVLNSNHSQDFVFYKFDSVASSSLLGHLVKFAEQKLNSTTYVGSNKSAGKSLLHPLAKTAAIWYIDNQVLRHSQFLLNQIHRYCEALCLPTTQTPPAFVLLLDDRHCTEAEYRTLVGILSSVVREATGLLLASNPNMKSKIFITRASDIETVESLLESSTSTALVGEFVGSQVVPPSSRPLKAVSRAVRWTSDCVVGMVRQCAELGARAPTLRPHASVQIVASSVPTAASELQAIQDSDNRATVAVQAITDVLLSELGALEADSRSNSTSIIQACSVAMKKGAKAAHEKQLESSSSSAASAASASVLDVNNANVMAAFKVRCLLTKQLLRPIFLSQLSTIEAMLLDSCQATLQQALQQSDALQYLCSSRFKDIRKELLALARGSIEELRSGFLMLLNVSDARAGLLSTDLSAGFSARGLSLRPMEASFEISGTLHRITREIDQVIARVVADVTLQGLFNPYLRTNSFPPVHLNFNYLVDPRTVLAQGGGPGYARMYDSHSAGRAVNRAAALLVPGVASQPFDPNDLPVDKQPSSWTRMLFGR